MEYMGNPLLGGGGDSTKRPVVGATIEAGSAAPGIAARRY